MEKMLPYFVNTVILLKKPIQQLNSVLPYQETILEMMTHPQLTPSSEAYIQSGLYRIIAMLEEEFHASYTTMESNENFYITQAVDYIKKVRYRISL